MKLALQTPCLRRRKGKEGCLGIYSEGGEVGAF